MLAAQEERGRARAAAAPGAHRARRALRGRARGLRRGARERRSRRSSRSSARAGACSPRSRRSCACARRAATPRSCPAREAESSAKLEALVERLDVAVAEGHKALVFSQWTSLLDLVEPALGAAGLAFTRLDGSTRDRAGVVASFAAPDGPPVLLISLRAGGTGLNLTQADHVFLLDPWWNPAVEDQAADRAHRIGQTRAVLVHRLIARDTVEEGILALQARKRAIAAAALDEGTLAAAMTRDDLLGAASTDA